MNIDKIKKIRLSCEFECFPLWIYPEDDIIPINLNHNNCNSFNIEDKLDLDLYHLLYQNTYNKFSPQDSSFENENLEIEFNELSKKIANNLIKYFPSLISFDRWDVLKESFEKVVDNE